MDETLNTIHLGDCIDGMNKLAPESVDLAFADPPFNIGYEYDVYNDKLGREKYLDWSREWISGVHRVLKPDGTFWLAIGDEYAAELKILSQEIGFHSRSWVVWYYTFGVNCKYKFTRSHAHLFYFVKDPDNFTFRSEDLENRIPSARELVYNDKRANPKGRLPDDTWMIRPADVVGEIIADDGTWSPDDIRPTRDTDQTWTLRPQDIETCFQADENTWYFPRVAGTFKERQGFHGCQMPEQLLGRIIRSCSHEGEIVLDPFSGSATTLAVAKKLNRKYLGFELSEDYSQYGQERLSQIRIGDRLNGSAEPTKSAPKTHAKLQTKKTNHSSKRYAKPQLAVAIQGVTEAFKFSHDGFSADRVVADPDLNARFIDACTGLGIVGTPTFWNSLLFRIRKRGDLSHIKTTKRTSIPWEQCDPYLFASEIAQQRIIEGNIAESLDEILCNPQIALKFDKFASDLAPNYSALEYRWAALRIRKESDKAINRAKFLAAEFKNQHKEIKSQPAIPIVEMSFKKVLAKSGIYLISNEDSEIVYAGESLNLNTRFATQFSTKQKKHWLKLAGNLSIKMIEADCKNSGMLTSQCLLAREYSPRFNLKSIYEAVV